MAKTGTASLTIAELREFASFTEEEQLFIERGLDVGLGRGDAFKQWSKRAGDKAAIRQQYLAYRELRALRDTVPCETSLEGMQEFIGTLVRITAQDLAQEQISSPRAPVAAGRVLRCRRAAADPPVPPQDAAAIAERSRRHRTCLVRARAVLLSRKGRGRGGLVPVQPV
jgi:hypothetical protein